MRIQNTLTLKQIKVKKNNKSQQKQLLHLYDFVIKRKGRYYYIINEYTDNTCTYSQEEEQKTMIMTNRQIK